MSKRSDFEAPSPPRPRRADSRLIVESILEAALELGLDASMLSIAERAGVGAARPGTVNKQDPSGELPGLSIGGTA